MKKCLDRLILFLFFAFLFSFVLISCATVESETRRILEQDYGMTKEEAKTGAAHALRLHRAKKDSSRKLVIEKDEDGDKYYPIDFSSISIEEKIEKIEEILELLKLVEDERKLSSGDKQFLDYFPQITERLTRQRNIFEWQISRYAHVQRYGEFLLQFGLPGEELEKEKKLRDSAYVTCPLVDLRKDLVFKPQYVLLAEKEGRRDLLERIVIDWDYMSEESNPDYPEKDPTKDKIWKKKTTKLLFESIDVNVPSDRKADYVMVYRMDKNGNPEKYPVISVFRRMDSKHLTLALLDFSKSSDTSFGVPDQIMTIQTIEKGSDLVEHQRDFIDIILNPDSRKENGKFKFNEKKMEVFLSQPGELEVSEGEINEDGWNVPLAYKVANKMSEAKNFEVYIKYQRPEVEDGKNYEKKIEHAVFKYHSASSKYIDAEGRVTEFYKPKKDFQDLIIAKINIKGKEITLFPKDAQAIQLLANSLISEKPYRIDYDFGKERISIIDKNGDGVYTLKRSQLKPAKVEFQYDVKPESAPVYYDGH